MKRALAERAKQSGLPNGVAPATPSTEKPITSGSSSTAPSSNASPALTSSASSSKAPLKIERHEGNNASSGHSARNSTTSPRPKKRMRESVVKLEEEDEEDTNASAFYLRHQNRALASELRSMKHMLLRLEREREYRRSQCTQAVQSLNALQATWTQMEAALQCGQPPLPLSDTAVVAPATSSTAPGSTGSGASVELIGALLDSLQALGTITPSKGRRRIKGGSSDGEDSSSAAESDGNGAADSMEVDGAEKQHLDDLLRITDNIAKRAATLQRWIWSLLQRVQNAPNSPALELSDQAQEQVIALKAKNKSLKAKLKEIVRSRDEMCESEKRVRRGLYRLAAGRVQLKEVLKAIATSDEDKEAAAAWMEAAPPAAPTISSSSNVTLSKANATMEKPEPGNEDPATENVIHNAEIHKQIADLEEVAAAREEQIKQLLSEREDHVKRINSLLLKDDSKTDDVLSDHEVKKSDLYAEMTVKLATSERRVEELEEKLSKMKEEWSVALADADLARTTMEEMHSKHMKRWAELTDTNGESGDSKKKADEIITLQHKLTQALENVRQAETTKQTLHEAIAMNESLQAKLEEIRSKYSALQAGRSSSANSSNHNSSSSAAGGVTTPKPKASSSSSNSAEKSERHDKEKSDKYEKLHRECRRARKELAAATASKEAAKAKLERTEKERDSLNQTNSRLLRQATEKDEMNAKSLSTILHLKQLTEQITKEKENLEQQVKSSQQVSLATRLATNARERVSEEFEKERKALESTLKEWEQKFADLAKEKETLEGKMTQEIAKMTAIVADAEKARKRCEELVSESTKLQEEKQKMMESLAVAQREAAEAANMSERLAKQSGGGVSSGFTAEQLSTQVSVLKSRLACPVCNHRDKKCILLRCRHMFCKQCVDENIKNRSRKCPACGGRFDTKDVADVWL